jgi:hypothetical protein
MRELEYTFQKGMQRGLRPDKSNPFNNEFLTECFNLKGTSLGIVSYKELINPFSATVTWPFPQFFAGMTQGILCSGNEVFTVGSDYSLITKASCDQSTLWSMADFGSYVVLTNGLVMIISDPTTGIFTVHTTAPSDIPICSSVCNFKGQLVGGGILSSWYGESSNSVIWSDIGSVNCIPSGRNEAGHRPMPCSGSVIEVKRLGDFCIVYGDSGINALIPSGQTFGLKEISSIGIFWKGSVGGDLEKHLFLSSLNELWIIDKSLDPKRLGYQEFMETLSNPIISYDSVLDEFHISDKTNGYVLTCTGKGSLTNPTTYSLSKCYQFVTSIGIFNGSRNCVCKSSEEYSVQVTTDVFDFGVRSMKTIGFIECDAISNVGLYLAVDYRYDRRGAFTRSPWRYVGKEGVVWCGITATDFRLCLKSVIVEGDTLVMEDGSTIVLENNSTLLTEGSGEDDYRNFSLSKINCKVKMSDRRFLIRGQYSRRLQE